MDENKTAEAQAEAQPTPEAVPAPAESTEVPVGESPAEQPAEDRGQVEEGQSTPVDEVTAAGGPEGEAHPLDIEGSYPDSAQSETAVITGDVELDTALVEMDSALIILRKCQDAAGRGMKGRDLAVAITNLETACMYAKRSHKDAVYTPLNNPYPKA